MWPISTIAFFVCRGHHLSNALCGLSQQNVLHGSKLLMGILSTPLTRSILLGAGVAAATFARGGQLSASSKAASLIGAAVYVGASFW